MTCWRCWPSVCAATVTLHSLEAARQAHTRTPQWTRSTRRLLVHKQTHTRACIVCTTQDAFRALFDSRAETLRELVGVTTNGVVHGNGVVARSRTAFAHACANAFARTRVHNPAGVRTETPMSASTRGWQARDHEGHDHRRRRGRLHEWRAGSARASRALHQARHRLHQDSLLRV